MNIQILGLIAFVVLVGMSYGYKKKAKYSFKKKSQKVAYNAQVLNGSAAFTSGAYNQISFDVPDQSGSLLFSILKIEVIGTTLWAASKYQRIYLTNESKSAEPNPDSSNVVIMAKLATIAGALSGPQNGNMGSHAHIDAIAPIPTTKRKLYIGMITDLATETFYGKIWWVPRSLPSVYQEDSMVRTIQF